jgi:predicted ATPase/DNA-binding CsgD family transcriptional regulator
VRRDLPVATTSLVGRGDDVARVTASLAAGRLVTVTGPPGVGKSRVAAAAALAESADNACRVDLAEALAEAADTDAVAHAVLSQAAAGRTRADSHDPLQALLAWLDGQELVLVLDNCDPVIAGCADFADQVRHACPQVRVLASSRQPLRVAGEHRVDVAPLAVPPADAATWPTEDLARYDAVQLFTERAEALRPGFVLTADLAPAVIAIARGVSGVPLGLELAAARLGVLSATELADRLATDPVAVLSSGERTAPTRHRSLRAALDSSHRLLNAREQTLLRRLAVFADGCTLDAVEGVCRDAALPSEAILDVLAGLVDKSLVACDTSGEQARYQLWHPVRCYALARLAEADETETVRLAHVEWAVSVAERAEPEVTNGAQQPWLARLDAEHANLVAALEWATTNRHGGLGLRLAAALAAYWYVRGHYREGRPWLEAALDAGADQPQALRAKVLRGLGSLAGLGDQPAATVAAQESLDLARDYGDTSDTLRALATLGALRLWPEPVAALPDLENAVALARERGDRWALVEALGLCARAYMWRWDVEHARTLFEECLEVSRHTGNQRGIARGLIGLGWAAVPSGDDATATARFEHGLQAARTAGAAYEMAEALSFLGEQARRHGDLDKARPLLTECRSTAEFVGSPVLTARAHAGLGRLAHAEGDPATAHAHLDEALALARNNGLQFILVRCLLAQAAVTAAEGDADAARDLFEHARHAADDNADLQGAGDALAGLARLAAETGHTRRAKALHADALGRRRQIPDLVGVAESLEVLAELAARDTRWVYAARLFGAAQRLRTTPEGDRPHPPPEEVGNPALAHARHALGPADFDEAWAQGAGMSWQDAVAYATRGHGPQRQASRGWDALTPTERHVAVLAGQRLTNAEIGQRLFISPRTVGNHLYRIYTKLGVSSRHELDALIPDEYQ